MRVCVMVEGQEGVAWEQWAALARACDEAGLDGLFRSDHYASTGAEPGALDAWATLAALAAITERIRLGTLVSPVTFRHPSVLAKNVVTVDHVSGGRVEVGIGAGWIDVEHRAYGFPFPEISERLELLAEQVEIVHRLLTEERVDFEGRHYRLDGAQGMPKPVQRPRPPIVLGGSAGRGTLEPAIRFADEYNTPTGDLEEVRRRRGRVREACERGGRDPASLPFSIMTGCVVAGDERELRERLERVARQVGSDADGAEFGRRVARSWVVGTTAQVVERLGELAEAGVERAFLQHWEFDDDAAVRLLGAEVAPALA
jgi:F420-dependent oxidoreductase-like protein